jgi:hypothetical protein
VVCLNVEGQLQPGKRGRLALILTLALIPTLRPAAAAATAAADVIT